MLKLHQGQEFAYLSNSTIPIYLSGVFRSVALVRKIYIWKVCHRYNLGLGTNVGRK